MARREGRSTDELMVLYVLERFLYRVSLSYRDKLVLKGGLLLAILDANSTALSMVVPTIQRRQSAATRLAVLRRNGVAAASNPLSKRADAHSSSPSANWFAVVVGVLAGGLDG